MEVNIFIKTLSRFREQQTFAQIAKECKKQLKTNIFKAIGLKVGDIIHRFSYFEKKYYCPNAEVATAEWREDQKKVFLCFVLAFCRLYFRQVSEITEREWDQVSEAFGNKDVLFMKYQARVLERCSERVRWTREEELFLQNCIKLDIQIKWSEVSKNLFLMSKGQYYKTPKQCSQHWFNYLNKNIQVRQWNVDQDIIILQYVLDYGHKWANIVDLLQKKRTQHMVKNRFYSILKSFNNSQLHKDQKNQRKIVKIIVKELYRKTVLLKNCFNSSVGSSLKIQQKFQGQKQQQQQLAYKKNHCQSVANMQLKAFKIINQQNSCLIYQKQQNNKWKIQQSNACLKKSIEQQQKMSSLINQYLFNNSIFYQMNHFQLFEFFRLNQLSQICQMQ